MDHGEVGGPGVDRREVGRREVLGEHDGLDGERLRPVHPGEADEQFDVEGLVEGGQPRQHGRQRSGVEGLEARLGVQHVCQGRDQHGPHRVPEQDDQLVGLAAGAVWLGVRAIGLDQDGARHAVTLAEGRNHAVARRDRCRERGQLSLSLIHI